MTELTVITDRDLKIAYIDKEIGNGNDEYYKIKRAYLESVSYLLVCDILERDPEDNSEGFLRYWHSSANDVVIESIDWTILNQCPECHTYFDNADGVDDDRFCSDECKYEIELGRKHVRGHNLFNV